MGWYAKPSGPYSLSSAEGQSNILEIAAFLSGRGYTQEAQGGICGNISAESGVNPWRWQSDTVNLSAGYGLVQYTPARGYIDGAKTLPGYGPNMSVSQITTGAKVTDAIAQLTAFAENTLGKWVSYCWRDYWDIASYPDLYADRNRIINTYGSNNRLSMSQFSKINNLYDATFAFLACFEGPSTPNMSARYSLAQKAYEIITGGTPPEPPEPPEPPGPPGPGSYPRKLPIWLYIKHL